MASAAGAANLEASDILEPELNLDLGARYLAEQLRRFGQADDADGARSVTLAAAAYNAGPGRVMAAQSGAGLPAETQRYQRWVSGMWAERRLPDSASYRAWWSAGGRRLVELADASQR